MNGRVVLAPGDINLTFKRHIETPVSLTIENDFITKIEGAGVDTALFESQRTPREWVACWVVPSQRRLVAVKIFPPDLLPLVPEYTA